MQDFWKVRIAPNPLHRRKVVLLSVCQVHTIRGPEYRGVWLHVGQSSALPNKQ